MFPSDIRFSSLPSHKGVAIAPARCYVPHRRSTGTGSVEHYFAFSGTVNGGQSARNPRYRQLGLLAT
ncbi:MAG: hypothetical protein ACI8QS_001694 [Planctomycetota bacterium]|jgi:hypothetical protein